ncbi:hypothetical protein TSAR_010066 [Trichomalopsis sarcophagae]|uniref:Uncharacterized protein n=1 Tax=Trichomalopsis sarcophagae TaxID=543379 RepID=A0A232FK61_9HYME|nr:hypothetical protein TSAR_010066 [Trichomalopsis sarcophagae]
MCNGMESDVMRARWEDASCMWRVRECRLGLDVVLSQEVVPRKEREREIKGKEHNAYKDQVVFQLWNFQDQLLVYSKLKRISSLL